MEKKRISRKLYRIAYIIIGAILAMLPKLPVFGIIYNRIGTGCRK